MKQSARNEALALKGRLDSLFGNSATIAYGAFGTMVALALCYTVEPDWVFVALAAGAAVLAVLRLLLSNEYNRFAKSEASNHNLTIADLSRWNNLCISGGVLSALSLGIWCFYVQYNHSDPFIVLTAYTATIANMVGICGRNYPSATYVNLQMLATGMPMVVGILTYGNFAEKCLGALLLTYMLSTISMAKSMRTKLDTLVLQKQEIVESEAQLSTAMEIVPSGLTMFSDAGTLIFANTEARDLLSISDQEFDHGFSLSSAMERLCAVAQNSHEQRTDLANLIERRSGTYSFKGKDGRSFTVASGHSSDGGLLLRIDDVSEQMNAQSTITHLSQFDSLTGVANRGRLFERAHQLCADFDGFGLAFAVIDVDNFKAINDSHGHEIGDSLLKNAANRLNSCCDKDGVCGRIGGDEFVLIQIIHEASSFVDWCSRVENAVNETIELLVLQLDLAASVGVRLIEGEKLSSAKASNCPATLVNEAISQADFAQYYAKRDETISLQVFDKELQSKMEREAILREGLVKAIKEGTLETAFQILVDNKTGIPKSAEALARWTHAELGPVSPAEFIPLAEKTGAVRELTIWQLENACRCCAQWPNEISVSVNFSAKDFASENIVNAVEKALMCAGLPASRLIIEITETAMLELRAEVLVAIEKIRKMGVRIALDDFGTGYSSLSYLHKIPFDILKIDRSFLEAINNDPRQLQVVEGITKLARLLDKTVVIEGIETPEMLETLNENVDFDLAQGFLFGRPLPERDIKALVSAFDRNPVQTPVNLAV